MPTEVTLPPIDSAKTPPSSAFNPNMFAAAKGEVVTPAEHAAVELKVSDAIKAEVKGTTPEDEAAARLLADELEENQRLDAEREAAKKAAEAEAKKPKPEKKVAEPEKEEVEEVEKQEEVEKEPELKPLEVKKKGKPAPTEEEELAQFDEESLPFAKQMSRPARQWALKQLAEKKRIAEEAKNTKQQTGLPESYYLHEEAYTLDPQFKASQGVLTQAQNELNYWKSQFAKVRSGEAQWTDLAINAQGQLVEIPREANAEAETDLIQRINHADTLVKQHAAAINYIKQTHKQRMSAGLEGLKTVENQFFPQFADEKSLKGHKSYKAIEQMLTTKGLGQVVPSSLFTKLFLAAQDMQEYIAELEGEKGEVKEEVKSAPTSADFKGGVGKKSGKATNPDEKAFDANEFERIKAMRR